MRLLDEHNVRDIATGAAVLATGGGSNPYLGTLMAREAIRQHGPVKLLTLDEMDDDVLVVPSAGMGAPTVGVEKIPNGDDAIRAFQTLERYLGRPVGATMSIEAGGGNSIIPLYVAARLGIPVVDADGMGRAFPEIQMVTQSLYGISATPFAMSDERGNVIVMETIDNNWAEVFARDITVHMGARSMIALYAATVRQLKEAAVAGTISRAEDIGRTIRLAQSQNQNPVAAVCAAVGGFVLFTGKINDVKRRTLGGFARGDTQITGTGDFAGKALTLDFQNEYLIARQENSVVASVPDLITVLEIDTGQPITTESLRYGFRVAVIGFPCSEKWRTTRGLQVVGPRYFGYDIDYIPIEERYKQ